MQFHTDRSGHCDPSNVWLLMDSTAKRITIDPLTRLEGHGKIEIFLDESGNVERAFLQVPELRGFEVFLRGRPAEEMPRLTSKICGVCPTAHHICSAKALDDLYRVEPPPAARKLRELMYSAFMFEDHLLHFFFLGGVDLLIGPEAKPSDRNIFGVISRYGASLVRDVIRLRKECRDIISFLGGRVIHPVCGLPGGVSKAMTETERERIRNVADEAVSFALSVCRTFADIVLKGAFWRDLHIGTPYYHETYYMGVVDRANRVNFYDGDVRVVTPAGNEYLRFSPKDYLRHIAERVETWTYSKFLYLKKPGWQGLVDGANSGIYRVAPLARLNVADGMATPLAQDEFERFFTTLGGKPVHDTLAFHWARLIEALYAAERLRELAMDDTIMDTHIRNIPTATPREGIGIVEAPRGTLIHHYKTDTDGLITDANLIVATVHNAAALSLSVEKAARYFIRDGKVSDDVLTLIQMAFRAYDPCFACATHAAMKGKNLPIHVRNRDGELFKMLSGNDPPDNVGSNTGGE